MGRFLFVSILMFFLMSACHSSRQILSSPPVIANNTDSISIEYIEIVRIDTIIVEVPVPIESARQIVPDSMSHLETSLAESDAWINDDGTLGYSITNKPGKLEGEVYVPQTTTQNNKEAVREREIPVPQPYPVEVEREFTRMEQIKLAAFWYLVGAVIVSIGLLFRRPLWAVLRKIIRL